MIQRIQTLFLLAYFIVSIGCFFYYPMALFSEIESQVLGYFPLLLAFLALVLIFSFKNRKRQLNFCKVLLCLHLFQITWGIYVFYSVKLLAFELGLLLAYAVFGLFLIFLALRGIKKDEALIRSLDRLR